MILPDVIVLGVSWCKRQPGLAQANSLKSKGTRQFRQSREKRPFVTSPDNRKNRRKTVQVPDMP